MSEGGAVHLVVRCKCGTKLKIPVASAGKKGRCPRCQAVFKVPQPQRKSTKSPDTTYGLAPAGDGAGLLDDLAAMESSAMAESPSESSAPFSPCPRCGARLASDAVLCVKCGFNVATGKSVKEVSVRKSKAADATRRLALGARTFALGCALSGVGALLGAAIWAGIALAIGFEIGWVAWGLGGLAGFGMLRGYRSANVRAGVAASAIAVLGIVGAKAVVFLYLSYPNINETRRMLAAMADERADDRERLATHRADLRARHMGFSYDDERRDEYWDEEYVNALELSEEELTVALAELDAWEAGEKWADDDYVRGFLIYDHVDESLAQQEPDDDGEYVPIAPKVWRRLYREAENTVNPMSTDERRERAVALQHERERVDKANQIVWHRTELATFTLPPDTSFERAAELSQEHNASLQSKSDAELDAALAEIEEWNNGGKWENEEYVRNFWIRGKVVEVLDEKEMSSDTDEDSTLSDAEWNGHWASAERDAAGMSHDGMVTILREREAKQEAERAKYAQVIRRAQADSVAGEITDEAFTFFAKTFFSPMDLIFIGLAVITAFKVAMGAAGGAD